MVPLPGGIKRRRGSDGHRRQRRLDDGFRHHQGHNIRRCALHLRRRGRNDHRLDPTVDAGNGVIAYDDGNGGAVYKGLAIASDGTNNFLFATDFHNSKVDVFDKTFTKVTTTGGFADPTLPATYAPFGSRRMTA